MAKVSHISRETIKALSGQIDFYYWKKIPVARKWPDWTNFKPSQNQQKSMQQFKEIRQAIKGISNKVRDNWRQATTGKTNSWVDLFTYLSFQQYKAGQQQIQYLQDYTKTETDEEITIELTLSTTGQIKAEISDGFYKSTRRVVKQKGKNQVCHDPPAPAGTTTDIDIDYGAGQTKEITANVFWYADRVGHGEGEDYEQAFLQALNEMKSQEYYTGSGMEFGYRVLAENHSFYEDEPDYYWVEINESFGIVEIDLSAWYEQTPDKDPTIIKIYRTDGIDLEAEITGTIKVGYANPETREFEPVNSFFYLTTPSDQKVATINFLKQHLHEGNKIYVRFQPLDDFYETIPSPPAKAEEKWTGWKIFWEYPYWKVEAQITSTKPRITIKKQNIKQMKNPRLFLYTSQKILIAPPLPLM